MTGKPKLIVWGGFWTDRTEPLRLDDLNSHASVTCYFLSEALARHFEVVQIPCLNGIVSALDHPDALGVLSTFQAGFTQLRDKKPDLHARIAGRIPGLRCAIVDFPVFRRYQEDILFCVLPRTDGLRDRLREIMNGAERVQMGWCAAPAICTPAPRGPGAPLSIFVDHGHYGGPDRTATIMDGINRFATTRTPDPISVTYQGNRGIAAFEIGSQFADPPYERENKVPWQEIQSHYARADIFCVTHRESAGLAVIEAAMAGAHVLVPEEDGSPFIHRALLDTGLPHTLCACTPEAVAAALSDIADGKLDATGQHRRLADSHGWHRAAGRIAERFMGMSAQA